jgi:hypothetical protein
MRSIKDFFITFLSLLTIIRRKIDRMRLLNCLLALASLVGSAAAFDYSITGAGEISLTDQQTSIGSIISIFTGEFIDVAVEGLEWEETGDVDGSADMLFWETSIDGEVQSTGSMSLADVGRELPTSIDVGSVKTSKKGRRTIEVKITVDSSTASVDIKIQAYAAVGTSQNFLSISEYTKA